MDGTHFLDNQSLQTRIDESISNSLTEAGCSLLGDNSLSLSSGSVAVLLLSLDVLDESASSSSGSVSSNRLDRPHISSLLSVESTSSRGILLLLLVEVRLSTESTDDMRMIILLTCCWGTSRL